MIQSQHALAERLPTWLCAIGSNSCTRAMYSVYATATSPRVVAALPQSTGCTQAPIGTHTEVRNLSEDPAVRICNHEK